jgi:hypothetical protein
MHIEEAIATATLVAVAAAGRYFHLLELMKPCDILAITRFIIS